MYILRESRGLSMFFPAVFSNAPAFRASLVNSLREEYEMWPEGRTVAELLEEAADTEPLKEVGSGGEVMKQWWVWGSFGVVF